MIIDFYLHTFFSYGVIQRTCFSNNAIYGINMELQALQKQRDIIYSIASKYGAENIRIFGSVATGHNRPDSDVDFLVNLAPGKSLFDLGGLLTELNNLLGCKVDVVTEAGLRPRIRNRILKEAVVL